MLDLDPNTKRIKFYTVSLMIKIIPSICLIDSKVHLNVLKWNLMKKKWPSKKSRFKENIKKISKSK